ncbi:MAG: hypothetical protein U1F66_00820 [bacterium]
MTTRVNDHHPGTTVGSPKDDYPDYPPEDNYEGPIDSGSPRGDFVDPEGMQPEASASEARKRIELLRATIMSDPKLDSAKKHKLLNELTALSGKINHAVSMDPKHRQSELNAIGERLGQLEMPAYGLEDQDIQDIGGDPGKGEGGEEVKDLQEKAKKIQDKLEKMLSSGQISQRVYDKLQEKLTRLTSKLEEKPDENDLEAVSSGLSSINEDVNAMASQYMVNGELIDEIPGDEGEKIKKDELPPAIQKLMSAVPGMTVEKFLAKLLEGFPNLDSNGDGKLSLTEIKDGAASNLFPPSRPNNDLIKFLTSLDPELKDKWEATHDQFLGDNDGPNTPVEQKFPIYRSLMVQVSQRLVTLLGALYPGKVSMQDPNTTDWRNANNLIFLDAEGKKQIFEAFREDTVGREVHVKWSGESPS